MHTPTNFDQTDHSEIAHYDDAETDEYLSDSNSCIDNRSDLGLDNYNDYESNYESDNEGAPCASTSTIKTPLDLLNAIREIFLSPPRDMSDKKGHWAVINIDASQEDMETTGVKAQEVFIRICLSFIRALYQILDCSWESILNGLVIATSSDSSKCNYHVLYALALLIDYHELKAFTELVYTLTAPLRCPFCKRIHNKDQQWFSHVCARSGKFIVKCFWQNSDEYGVIFECDLSIAEKNQQENKKSLQFFHKIKVLGFPKAFVNFPFWAKYNEPLSATETYEEKYVRPLSNEGDIYVDSPWETGKTYVLEHLTISDDVNLLVLSTHHSYLNAVTTRLNLKSYCDIDGNINLPDHKRVLDEIVSIIAQAQSHLAG
ncbi:unnamed protein product [Rhizophagus irregularis]|nr:unnamed protein product [Rhizophagus irregularis]